ncbi:putative transposase [Flammeovirgaceae bacterium 311]|nr:putative transposase [Flammeovirgaceae bacterium 311]AHM59305.1 putative transposase [Flammeovirgaceae bacterium 311]AHM60273.1 putative transposase [Flammeovirgaceae bacterium 311]AHM62790.1 putative transposase [Flammeovirgaceae bacterium 311]AHM63512.1 putative transposase [Flammeovirgaceae bacterium 311]
MEAVLDTYQRDAEPGEVRLCLDERPCQLLEDVREPLPMKEGRSRKQDSEYKRNGVCNIFLAYDMDKAERYCQTTVRRTKADFALFLDRLLTEKYPDASKVTIVLDNLNIHGYGSFFAALPEKRAMELREKISFCYTPKHGSWLNMAEIEFSALSRQCLKQRIGSINKMKRIVEAWQQQRNQRKVKICWSFTSNDAHQTFKKFYPEVEFEN